MDPVYARQDVSASSVENWTNRSVGRNPPPAGTFANLPKPVITGPVMPQVPGAPPIPAVPNAVTNGFMGAFGYFGAEEVAAKAAAVQKAMDAEMGFNWLTALAGGAAVATGAIGGALTAPYGRRARGSAFGALIGAASTGAALLAWKLSR
jgi:hypothetical protein